MTTLPRRNPRRPAFLTAAGVKRIILGQQGEGGLLVPIHHHDAPKPLRLTGPARESWLVAVQEDRGGLDDHAKQAIAAAAILAAPDAEVVVLVFGAEPAGLAELGADRILAVPPQQDLAALKDAVARFKPRHILLPDNETGAGDLGRRLAAETGLSCACHVAEISAQGIAARRDGGRSVARRELPTILLLDPDIVDTDLPFLGRGAGEEFQFTAADRRVRLRSTETIPAGDMPLEEADFVMAAGNGVADVPTFLALAKSFGAAVGASRVAVDDGKFSRDKQVGATGKTVGASLYMAVGISGAVQHLQGIKACRHVVAINNDGSAPIAKRADLTVVGDAQEIMLDLLREISGRGRNDLTGEA